MNSLDIGKQTQSIEALCCAFGIDVELQTNIMSAMGEELLLYSNELRKIKSIKLSEVKKQYDNFEVIGIVNRQKSDLTEEHEPFAISNNYGKSLNKIVGGE
jgi:hypothetical protein